LSKQVINHRYLFAFGSLPSLVFYLYARTHLFESPSWLTLTGRKDKAIETLQEMQQLNKGTSVGMIAGEEPQARSPSKESPRKQSPRKQNRQEGLDVNVDDPRSVYNLPIEFDSSHFERGVRRSAREQAGDANGGTDGDTSVDDVTPKNSILDYSRL
jgi:hypothetical protein